MENIKNMNLPKIASLYISDILNQAKNGITITDPTQKDNPIIYVNIEFCKMFNYDYNEILGRNCRFLQQNDREQANIDKIRKAIDKKESITTILRNYKKGGELIYIELTISPIFNKDGKVVLFLGIQKDVTREMTLLEQIKGVV
jgi:PAS domain S-box-containing protein